MFVNIIVVKKKQLKEIDGNVPLRKICLKCKILIRKLTIIESSHSYISLALIKRVLAVN